MTLGQADELPLFPPGIEAAAQAVRLLALDVDGVLTDGRLHYGPDGEATKVFHVKDGLGIKLLEEGGVEVAVISARRAPALERRLNDLGISHVYLGRGDKGRALRELQESTNLDPGMMAFMGDDVLDLPVLRSVGLAIAPADAHFMVRRELTTTGWVTRARGGQGAVREVTDGLLAAQDRLQAVVAAHLEARNGVK